jgi:hypothetical protein
MDIDRDVRLELVQGRLGGHGVGRQVLSLVKKKRAPQLNAVSALPSMTEKPERAAGRNPAERALGATSSHQIVMAYRQAGMFVAYLLGSDARGFAHMMNLILDGRPFVEAVAVGYHEDVHTLWQKFANISGEQK